MIPHVAVPARDLTESITWYVKLGAKLGRLYATSAVLNFCGTQVVLHESSDVPAEPTMYPRHFGFILQRGEFEFWQWEFRSVLWKTATRFTAAPGEHDTFFLCDPSNNLIEFKTYRNEKEVFS